MLLEENMPKTAKSHSKQFVSKPLSENSSDFNCQYSEPCSSMGETHNVQQWWKELKIPLKDIKLLPECEICTLCMSAHDCEEKYGDFLYHPFSGLHMHYFCLLLSSGLTQSLICGVDEFNVEKESICGFSVKDIVQEVKRASRLRCAYCRRAGASVGCVVNTCKTMFHFPCGLENGVLSQYYQNFKSYCWKHRPKQTLKTTLQNGNIENLKEAESCIQKGLVPYQLKYNTKSSVTSKCPICFEDVQCSLSDFQSLVTTCCMDVWLHRSCVQQQALSSGMHFFRCPVCNDSKTFTEEMQRLGIYVPDRDASWELSNRAYDDLLYRHAQCDVEVCHCPHGRDYNLKGSEWSVVLCDLCGSSGTHIACDDDVDSETSYHVCRLCLDIHGVDGACNLAIQMGVLSPRKVGSRRSERIRGRNAIEEINTKRPCTENIDGQRTPRAM